MMDYRLELLDEDTFENLINTICQTVLGTGVISFSKGKDGGRDGKFTGKAQEYPSKTKSWEGKFVIQSKHTSNSQASCSDKEFAKLVDKEIPKLKKLFEAGDVDNYLLFTNRKYTGIAGEKLLKKIVDETNIENVVILGKEVINDRLNANRGIVRQYKLDLNHIPFDFSDEEIKEIIVAFKDQLQSIEDSIKSKVAKIKFQFDSISLAKKNKLNGMGEEYYSNEIKSRSLLEFDKISQFLHDPINSIYKDYFYDTASELSQLIIVKRDNFDAFEEIFIHIYKLICDGVVELKGSKKHVTTLLHFMYAECLIGVK